MPQHIIPTQIERPCPSGPALASKTDTEGKLTYANQALTATPATARAN